MKRGTLLCVACAAALASGCSDEFRGACTANIVFGLQVHVVNDQSGAPICDAVVTASDGAYSATLDRTEGFNAGCYYVGASERAGVYSLHAEAPGFSPATATAVAVHFDGCHVETVSRTMRLVPLGQN